jgi:hypothetical protein
VAPSRRGGAKGLDRFYDDQMASPGTPKPRGLLAEDRGPRLSALGAYIGELIRHRGVRRERRRR